VTEASSGFASVTPTMTHRFHLASQTNTRPMRFYCIYILKLHYNNIVALHFLHKTYPK
jgi:hypothetical protein